MDLLPGVLKSGECCINLVQLPVQFRELCALLQDTLYSEHLQIQSDNTSHFMTLYIILYPYKLHNDPHFHIKHSATLLVKVWLYRESTWFALYIIIPLTTLT